MKKNNTQEEIHLEWGYKWQWQEMACMLAPTPCISNSKSGPTAGAAQLLKEIQDDSSKSSFLLDENEPTSAQNLILRFLG